MSQSFQTYLHQQLFTYSSASPLSKTPVYLNCNYYCSCCGASTMLLTCLRICSIVGVGSSLGWGPWRVGHTLDGGDECAARRCRQRCPQHQPSGAPLPPASRPTSTGIMGKLYAGVHLLEHFCPHSVAASAVLSTALTRRPRAQIRLRLLHFLAALFWA